MPKTDLFKPLIAEKNFHPIFAMLLQDRYAAEREVLKNWADGFVDRDGKFVQEFQNTFESSMWELYVYAALRRLSMEIDFSYHTPDFVVTRPLEMLVEATIASPAEGGKPAFGYSALDIPNDFNEFNREAILRICNSFDSKIKRFRNYYSTLLHTKDRPFVIAIGAFDRPLAHLAGNRSIIAALYGIYFDEQETIARDSDRVISYNIESARKSNEVDIQVGLFCDKRYAEVSAVIYSATATWGKLRALAEGSGSGTIFQTYHPNADSLLPKMRTAIKTDYREDLMDGLYVLHNPFATHPLSDQQIDHPRIASVRISASGELLVDMPDDFLLLRMLHTVRVRGKS